MMGNSSRVNDAEEDLREMLSDGEELVYQCVIHDAIYWKAVAVLALAFVFAVFIAIELGILLLVVGLAMLSHAILTKNYLLLALSNQRVLARYGVLQVDMVDMNFDRVESIELERMLPGQMFGYANVIVTGTGNRYLRIPFVANPRAFRRAYHNLTLKD